MATFITRKNGSIQAKIRRHGVAVSETFSTRSDAEAWARKQESEVERGLWRDSAEAERTTLADALARYQKEVSEHKRGQRQEISIIGILSNDPIAKLTLARVRGADVSALLTKWRKLYAAATITRRLALLSHLFEMARKEWGMEGLVNPVQQVKLPKIRNSRERRVTDDEIELLINTTKSTLLPAIIRLAVETAMRRGEIVELDWKHVDLAKRVAHLPITKNGSTRDVPLSTKAIAVLQGLPRNISGVVFNIRWDAVTQAFARACERAGLADLRFHDLRHEATSRLADLLQLHELMKVTGHKDTRMLARYYHPRAEDLAKKLG